MAKKKNTKDIEEFAELKKKAQQMTRIADKAEAALLQVESDLKEQFGCDSIEEAEEKYETLKTKSKKQKKKYLKAKSDFETEWEKWELKNTEK
jgi:hypothetical protein